MAKLATKQKRKFELKCGSYLLHLGDRTHIMGVLNRTPDSFSDGGMFTDEDAAIRHIKKMVDEGADIIDIGGESTRPGSEQVTLSEELDRTIPIIKKIAKKIDAPISIDTSKYEVALEALKAGASIVNDITGLKSDPKMADVVSEYEAAVCVMHIKGTPRDMQDYPTYYDLIGEIIESLEESINVALKAGVSHDKIMIDPGIGFGKTVDHNLTIINRLAEFKILERPILIGTSRKSFIGKVLDKDVNERIMGTAATCALAIINGANIIRVHDIKEMCQVARMADAIKRAR